LISPRPPSKAPAQINSPESFWRVAPQPVASIMTHGFFTSGHLLLSENVGNHLKGKR
jgi:hypothetical protein